MLMPQPKEEPFILDMSFEQAIKHCSTVSSYLIPEDPTEYVKAAPFVKWVGGKRSLIDELVARFPSKFGSYWEPFAGGGALFLVATSDSQKLSFQIPTWTSY